MKFILDIVKPYLSPTNISELSLACISTSNPVYLVFEAKQSAPSLIVRSAGSTDVVKAHKVTESLYQTIPELIPEPVAIVNTEQGEYAIQRGVSGLPWFQIANEFKSADDWNSLRERALNALDKLHAAIQLQEEERDLNVYLYSQQCLNEALSAGLSLNEAQVKKVQSRLECLKDLPKLPIFSQHGDYCLNNLIIEKDHIHIIDFEDYGMTCLPFFDYFSLALSLSSSTHPNSHLPVEQEVELCTKFFLESYKLTKNQLSTLFLVHLLVRLGQWSNGGQRKVFRDLLIDKLLNMIEV